MSEDSPKPNIETLLEIMARLRAPDGCPWDREQDFDTIAPYTIEEAYEVADAIARRDMDGLKDELGDLLFQTVYHAQMAQERNAFTFGDVVDAICTKMIRRHPHVFGDADIASAAEQTRAWEEHKARERAEQAATDAAPPSALDGVPIALPALTRAAKLQNRAARTGFDWPHAAPVLDKVREEIRELETEIETNGDPERLMDELGDLLFAVTNLARHLSIDPEHALRTANKKFEKRFRYVEQSLRAQGAPLPGTPLDEMERLWQEAKRQEDASATPAESGESKQ